MKVGVILCAYQCADTLPEALTTWVAVRAARLRGDEFTICAVSMPFTGFDHGDESPDDTQPMIGRLVESGLIDHAIVGNVPTPETEARGMALQWLLDQKVDIVMLLDGDEAYSLNDVMGALHFVEMNPLVTWFRLPLRNYVFDRKTYLVEPFTPPRVFRVMVPGQPYRIHSFYDDNNVRYGGTITRDLKRDVDFASMTVPEALCRPRHWTWIDGPRSKRKIRYQLEGRGWPECSFRWDDATDSLRFNETYYAKRGLPLPEVVHE